MASDLSRELSFRSALLHQKRKLSAAPQEHQPIQHLQLEPKDLKENKSNIFNFKTGLLKGRFGRRSSSVSSNSSGVSATDQEVISLQVKTDELLKEKYEEEEEEKTCNRSVAGSSDSGRCSMSEGSHTRESSPDIRIDIICSGATSLSVSPIPPESPLLPPTPDSPRKTPIPSDSPLLTHKPDNEALKRVRSFNRSLRKARNFRMHREKSAHHEEPDPDPELKEITFTIRKTKFGRRGWKVMPEDECNLKRLNAEIMERVMARIRDMEFSGKVIPEKMTVPIEEEGS